MNKNDLRDAAQTAVRIAKVSPPNESYALEPSENIRKDAPTDFWEDAVVDLSLSTQKEWAKAFLSEAIRDARFRLNEGSLGVEGSLGLISNSVGTHKFHRESVCAWSLMGLATEAEKITSFDYYSELSRTLKGLPEQIIQSAAHFRDKMLSNLITGPATSYLGAVVFSPRAVLDILARPLLYHLNGRNIVEGSTKWSVKQVGDTIVNPLINISDTPWNTQRFGASVFDREGSPTANRNLVENGKLNALLLDQYSAKALSLKSTGNAVGAATTIPTVGAHNICVAPGETDLGLWMKECGKSDQGVLLVNRFSGRTDPVTGDFSGIAKGAEWWARGEKNYVVQDTMISGNLFDALSSKLLGVTNRSFSVDCNGDSPHLIIGGVSVTSGKS